MKKSLLISLFLVLAISFTSCSEEGTDSQETKKIEFDNTLSSQERIRVKFMIGLTANLEKPSNNCRDGWGVCEVTIGIVNVGFYRAANIGISDDNNFYLEISEASAIENQTMQIEEGDEYITLHPDIITYFQQENIDISSIRFIKGEYPVTYNSETDTHIVKIPFERY